MNTKNAIEGLTRLIGLLGEAYQLNGLLEDSQRRNQLWEISLLAKNKLGQLLVDEHLTTKKKGDDSASE